MVGVVARYEHGAVPYLLPVSIDGLIVVLSVSLFDVAGQLREHLDAAPPTAPAVIKAPAARLHDATIQIEPELEAPLPATVAADDIPAPSDVMPDEHAASPELADDEDQDQVVDDDGASAEADERPQLPHDLVPLLQAARAARDELIDEGGTVSRDALAARLRRNGTPIRNTRASELLAALKAEAGSSNGSRPKASV